MRPKSSSAEAFGAFVAGTTFEDLPEEVVSAVRLRLLDTLGAALNGWRAGTIAPLARIIPAGNDATAWGSGTRVSARDAALLNGFLAHATYTEDGSRFTGGHPASATIPAAISMAEKTGAGGRDLVAAIAAGYEVFLRLGGALYPSTVRRGFQSTAVLAPLASAAAAARILRLSAEQSCHAIAIACNSAGGLKKALDDPRSQPLQVGRGCEAGVIAALLAADGVTGVDTIIDQGLLPAFADGADTTGMLSDLGERYSIGETYIKIHGGCRGIHAPVDALVSILRDNGLQAQDVRRVRVRVDTITRRADIDEPQNPEQAQFSIRFAAAVCLAYGDASTFRYTEENVASPEIRRLIELVEVSADPGLDAGYPDRRPAVVEVEDVHGRVVCHRLDHARGEPENPLADEEVDRKFFAFANALPLRRARKVHALAGRIETLPNLSELTSALAVP